jgi:putative heme-binding domain-containing protein
MMNFSTAAALLLCPFAAWAQSELDIAEGKAIFRSNCAFCHGLAGGGGRGPTLITGRFLHGSTDDDIRNVIRNGVPGTTMPSFENMAKDELDKLVQYIRSLAGANVSSTPVAGNVTKGRQVYQRSGCAGCHRIGTEGSIFGPELTRIGAGRSSEHIRQSILEPSADIPEDFEGVTVTTSDGKKITGMRINEDTFSVQLRDRSGKFHMFQKDKVQGVSHETKSLMPPYHSLSKDDLQNLLAYLDSLRGELNAGAGVKKAEGIK